MTRLSELRALLEQATPGPLVANYSGRHYAVFSAADEFVAEFDLEIDADAYIAAVNNLPALLDAVEALERIADSVNKMGREPQPWWADAMDSWHHIAREALAKLEAR